MISVRIRHITVAGWLAGWLAGWRGGGPGRARGIEIFQKISKFMKRLQNLRNHSNHAQICLEWALALQFGLCGVLRPGTEGNQVARAGLARGVGRCAPGACGRTHGFAPAGDVGRVPRVRRVQFRGWACFSGRERILGTHPLRFGNLILDAPMRDSSSGQDFSIPWIPRMTRILHDLLGLGSAGDSRMGASRIRFLKVFGKFVHLTASELSETSTMVW